MRGQLYQERQAEDDGDESGDERVEHFVGQVHPFAPGDDGAHGKPLVRLAAAVGHDQQHQRHQQEGQGSKPERPQEGHETGQGPVGAGARLREAAARRYDTRGVHWDPRR